MLPTEQMKRMKHPSLALLPPARVEIGPKSLLADTRVETVPDSLTTGIYGQRQKQAIFKNHRSRRRADCLSVGWQLVRQISTAQLKGTGSFTDGDPLEFAGNVMRIAPRPQMAATLTRTGVEFIRQTDQSVVASVNLVEYLGAEQLEHIRNRKVQPIVFTDDLSRVFIAGNQKLIVFDMLTLKIIQQENLELAKNTTSLATVGNLLLIGEGSPGGNNRLQALDISARNINPDGTFKHKPVTLKGTGIETAPNGIAGMVVGPDGRSLVVSTPAQPDNYGLGPKDFTRRGDILILDLNRLDMTTGQIAKPVVAKLPDDGKSGKAPMNIMATRDANRYLVANPLDDDRGLSTLVLTRNAEGIVTSAEMKAIGMGQRDEQVKIDRLDLQRAQSAVLVKVDGVEYALVGDDNFASNDPYWWQMYEAPTYIYTPSGPPIAVGGSANAKKVNVGGKIGIVKDPFGNAEYLGATLPLDGYGILNLGLSEDGKVLIGQLRGLSSANIFDNSPRPSQAHAWDVSELIKAALAQPEQDRLSKHLRLPPNAEQLVSKTNQQAGSIAAGWPIGTFFDPEFVQVSYEGRMGDVIGINIRDLVARKLLLQDGKLTSTELNVPWSKLSAQSQALIGKRMADLSEIELLRNDLDRLVAGGDAEWEPSMKLIAKQSAAGGLVRDAYGKPTPVSRQSDTGTADADYTESGVLFFVPNITQNDVDNLRAGRTVLDKYIGFFFRYKDAADKASPDTAKSGYAQVTAKDFASVSNIFFGDRPLVNPGYSEFLLKGSVGVKQDNDVLDVYRVEQRLKYLGYPAMGYTGPGAAKFPEKSTLSGTPYNLPQNFEVDGTFGEREQRALKLFEKTVRYDGSTVKRFADENFGADGKIEASGDQRKITLDYLNAYNAPHWMQIFAKTPVTDSRVNDQNMQGWYSTQTFTTIKKVEIYGTSWVYDLMKAKQYAPLELSGARTSRFNGTTDANLGFTPNIALGGHSTHDLGMAMDLGLIDYVSDKYQGTFGLENTRAITIPADIAKLPKAWDYGRAITLSALLPNDMDDGKPINNQRAATRDFLSLYWATKNDIKQIDANGNSGSEWAIVNGKTDAEKLSIQTALFRGAGACPKFCV